MSETIVCIPTCYVGKPLAYDTYLSVRGYDAEIRGRSGPIPAPRLTGMLQNGWLLVHADKQARVPDEHSETPHTTRRAMQFIDEASADGRP